MKVKGEGNLADGLTKPLEGPGVKKHISLTGQEVVEGRHVLTPDFEAAQDREKESGGNPREDQEGDEDEELCRDVLRFQSGSDVLELLCCNRITEVMVSFPESKVSRF